MKNKRGFKPVLQRIIPILKVQRQSLPIRKIPAKQKILKYLWLIIVAFLGAFAGYFLEIKFLPFAQQEADQEIKTALQGLVNSITSISITDEKIANKLAESQQIQESIKNLNFSYLDYFVKHVEQIAPETIIRLYNNPRELLYASQPSELFERYFSSNNWKELTTNSTKALLISKDSLRIWGSSPYKINDKSIGLMEVSQPIKGLMLKQWKNNERIHFRIGYEDKVLLSTAQDKLFSLGIKQKIFIAKAPFSVPIWCEAGVPSIFIWGLQRIFMPYVMLKILLWAGLLSLPIIWKKPNHETKEHLHVNIDKNKENENENEEMNYLRLLYSDFSNSLRKKNIEIQEAKEQVDAILRSVPDGVFTIDKMGMILIWNKGAENLTGWLQKEVLERPYQKILGLCYKEGTDFYDVVGEPPVDSKNIYLTAKNGEHVPIELTSLPVTPDDGNIKEIVMVVKDITRQKEIDRFKDDFIAMVTHDLRSPLSSILGYANLLLNPKANASLENRFKYTNAIIRACKGLSFFINNLLDSAKLEAGVMTFHMEHFNFNDSLIELKELFYPIAKDKGINFYFNAPNNVFLFGDREKIKQMLVNLLANAMKFTPPGGMIGIDTGLRDTRVEIKISDTGRGIPKEELPKLFQKFMQVKGEKVGTGLGLFIVRNIIDGHKGNITVESKIGEGTVFYISLPKGDSIRSAGFLSETRYRQFS